MSILQKSNMSLTNPKYMNNWFWADRHFQAKLVSEEEDRYIIQSPSLLQVDINGNTLNSTGEHLFDLSLDASWDHGTNLDHASTIAEWQASHDYSVGDWVRPTSNWLADGANNASTSYATYKMLSPILPFGVALGTANSSNLFDPTYKPANVFDQSTSTLTSISYIPCWLLYDFGTDNKRIINKFRYYGVSGYSPKTFKFQASNVDMPTTTDNTESGHEDDWETLYTGTNVPDSGTAWTSNPTYFTFSNLTPYRRYRLYISEGWNASSVAVYELHLVEVSDMVYRCSQPGNSGLTEPSWPIAENAAVGGTGGLPQWTAYLDNTKSRNRKGEDFYIYACTPVTGVAPVLLCSKNSTYPHNYNETNSKLIGGFHCLCERMSTPDEWAGGQVYYVSVTSGQGGSGYNVNDVLTLDGGVELAKAIVVSVSAGAVTGIMIDIYNTGKGYSTSTTQVTTNTTGEGSGCVLSVAIKNRALDETVVPTAAAISATPALANYWYRCITAGISHTTTEPTWNQVVGASPATDGTVTWICENKHSLADYVAGDILPNSVWDLRYRAVTDTNDGLVYCPELNKWVGIYLPSGTVLAPVHAFGGTILDTVDWNQAVDAGASLKMQLARDSEFEVFSEGSNQKTTIYGAADPATVTGAVDSSGRRCVSNIGVEGCCGVMYQWLDEQSYQYKNAPAHYHKLTGVTGDAESKTSGNAVAADGTTAQDLAPAWGWKALGNYRGSLYGQDSTTNYGDVKVIAGGSYDTTTSPAIDCGSLCRRLDYPRWTTAANISFRLVAKHVEKEYI